MRAHGILNDMVAMHRIYGYLIICLMRWPQAIVFQADMRQAHYGLARSL
jgi:hypothetical protein